MSEPMPQPAETAAESLQPDSASGENASLPEPSVCGKSSVNDSPDVVTSERRSMDRRSDHDSEDDDTCGDERRSMSCEQALECIRAGKAIQNVRIQGLLFAGEFSETVEFRNVHLVKPRFKKAVFRSTLVFARCCIDRPRFDGRNEFCKNLVLSNSTIIQGRLSGINVGGDLLANDIECDGKFVVEQSEFKGLVKFWEAHFRAWVDFKNCTFAGEADFRSLHADQGFVMMRCKFLQNVLFRGAAVAKKFEAADCRFDKLLDFSKAKLHDFVYLENITQGEQMRWAFNNAIGERLQVRPEQVEGRLDSEVRGDFKQAMNEYAFLKRSYASLHRFEQEDWAFYRFKVNQRRAATRTWTRPWTKLAQFCDWTMLDLGCGYGTNPIRAVRAAIIILLAFAAIYTIGFDKFHHEYLPFNDQPADSWPNRIVFGMVISVSVFTSGLSGMRDFALDWMNIPVIIEALLGTLLWGLFIVAFSRKVIR